MCVYIYVPVSVSGHIVLKAIWFVLGFGAEASNVEPLEAYMRPHQIATQKPQLTTSKPEAKAASNAKALTCKPKTCNPQGFYPDL